jgi:hypothetical protein
MQQVISTTDSAQGQTIRSVKLRTLLALFLAAISSAAGAAEPFAPTGAKATLSVEYVYESAGKKKSEGMYDPYEWRVKRNASLTAQLAAQPATAMPTVQAIDASQMASLQGKADKAQAVTTKMAPMMADVQKVMAKCGENEACISREIEKMGSAMAGSPQMAGAMSAKADIAELSKQDVLRYQAWRPTAQTGTYLIDETVHISVTDPICTSKPRHRCTRDETRKGGGDIPVPAAARTKQNKGAEAGISAVELDSAKGTLTVMLPVALGPLPYTETIVTDEPEGTHDTPTPKGPQQRQMSYRVNAAGSIMDKPITVALKGGWRSQQGEQVVRLKGNFGDEGSLTVRWRFVVQ